MLIPRALVALFASSLIPLAAAGAPTESGEPTAAGEPARSIPPITAPTLNAASTFSPAQSVTLPASALLESPASAAAPQASKTAAAATPLSATVEEPASTSAADRPVFFVQTLHDLGVSKNMTGRLMNFLSARRSVGLAYEVADYTARFVAKADLPADRKILLILTACLRDVDPARASDGAARALVAEFAEHFGFTPKQVDALILATDLSLDPAEMAARRKKFALADAEAFPGEDFGRVWGPRLAFFNQSFSSSRHGRPKTDAAQSLMSSIAADSELAGKRIEAPLADKPIPPLTSALKGKHGAALQKLADRWNTTPAAIQAVLARQGALDEFIRLEGPAFEAQADFALRRDKLERAVAGYSDNAQGRFMRNVAARMTTPSGESGEAIEREGVFAYVNFVGEVVRNAASGRDAISPADVIFYVTRKDKRWHIGVSHKNPKTPRSGAQLLRFFKNWLAAGGIPAEDIDIE